MGWGERQIPHGHDVPRGMLSTQPQHPTSEPQTHRERELENDMTRIALVATRAIREARKLPAEEAATFATDALRAIEKIATRKGDPDADEG